jgi:hypothetical protein
MPNHGLAPGSGDKQPVQIEIMLPVRRRRSDPSSSATDSREAKATIKSYIPRITRLMALAIKFQDMVDNREVNDYADIARLGYVTRARMTQIMNLLLLAPDIQERILSVNGLAAGIAERQIRELAGKVNWKQQRSAWVNLTAKNNFTD